MDFLTFTNYSLILLLPGFNFYLIFTIFLFLQKSKEFRIPFFNLIKLLAVIDLIFIPIHFWMYRIGSYEALFPFFATLDSKNVPMTIIQYLFCVFQHAQFLAHLLIAFNRLSAILLHQWYDRLWAVKHFWVYCCFVIGLPGIYMAWLLYYGSHMYYEEGYNYMVDSYRSDLKWLKKSTFCVVVGLATGAGAFIMDVATFYLIHSRTHAEYHQHLRLLGVSVVILITHICYMFFEIQYAFPFIDIDDITMFMITVFILDIQSLISPFCNIALNPSLRKVLMERRSYRARISVVSPQTSHSRHGIMTHNNLHK